MESINFINDISSGLIFVSFLIVFFGSVLQGRRKGLTMGNALGMGFRSVQKMVSAQAKTDTQEREVAKTNSAAALADGAMIGRLEFREVIRELIGEFTKQTADMAAERAVDIADLRTAQRAQQTDIGQLRDDLDAEKAKVAGLETELDTEKAKVSQLTTDLADTRLERDELNKRLDEMQKAHDRERAEDRAEYERRIAELMTQIEGKEARIKDLERQLEELRKAKTGSLTPMTAQETPPKKGTTDE